MNTFTLLLLPLAIIALIMTPLFYAVKKNLTGQKMKFAFVSHLGLFAGICIIATLIPLTGFAAETAATTVSPIAAAMAYFSAALVTGLAAIGAGIAVAAAAPAAIGACSEDPKSFGKSLIFVALGEGVAIYGLLISIMILMRV